MSDTPIIRYPLSAITGIGERDCKHGQQAMACNVCELERELAEAREWSKAGKESAAVASVELMRLTKERDLWRTRCKEAQRWVKTIPCCDDSPIAAARDAGKDE